LCASSFVEALHVLLHLARIISCLRRAV
jgi:hypothetical protein